MRPKSNFAQVDIEYICGQMHVYLQESPNEIETPNTLEPDQPQHDRLAASVIAQQYSSTIFVSSRCHSRNGGKKIGARFKNFI